MEFLTSRFSTEINGRIHRKTSRKELEEFSGIKFDALTKVDSIENQIITESITLAVKAICEAWERLQNKSQFQTNTQEIKPQTKNMEGDIKQSETKEVSELVKALCKSFNSVKQENQINKEAILRSAKSNIERINTINWGERGKKTKKTLENNLKVKMETLTKSIEEKLSIQIYKNPEQYGNKTANLAKLSDIALQRNLETLSNLNEIIDKYFEAAKHAEASKQDGTIQPSLNQTKLSVDKTTEKLISTVIQIDTTVSVPEFIGISHDEIKGMISDFTKIEAMWSEYETSRDEKILRNIQALIDDNFELTNFEITPDLGNKLIIRSTGDEDSEECANAGGNESIPNVENEKRKIEGAIKKVLKSYFSEKSIAQRSGQDLGALFMPILIQNMVPQETITEESKLSDLTRSGVMLSKEKDHNKKEDLTKISVAFGNNSYVVDGMGATDISYVDSNGHITRSHSEQSKLVTFDHNNEQTFQELPEKFRDNAKLPGEIIKELKELADTISTQQFDGKAVDIEFTIDPKTWTINLLQARPIVIDEMQPSNDATYIKSDSINDKEKIFFEPIVSRENTVANYKTKIFASNMSIALQQYLQIREVSEHPIIVFVHESGGELSHEALEFGKHNIPVMRVSETDIESIKKYENLWIDPQQGLAIDTESVETEKGLISYQMPSNIVARKTAKFRLLEKKIADLEETVFKLENERLSQEGEEIKKINEFETEIAGLEDQIAKFKQNYIESIKAKLTNYNYSRKEDDGTQTSFHSLITNLATAKSKSDAKQKIEEILNQLSVEGKPLDFFKVFEAIIDDCNNFLNSEFNSASTVFLATKIRHYIYGSGDSLKTILKKSTASEEDTSIGLEEPNINKSLETRSVLTKLAEIQLNERKKELISIGKAFIVNESVNNEWKRYIESLDLQEEQILSNCIKRANETGHLKIILHSFIFKKILNYGVLNLMELENLVDNLANTVPTISKVDLKTLEEKQSFFKTCTNQKDLESEMNQIKLTLDEIGRETDKKNKTIKLKKAFINFFKEDKFTLNRLKDIPKEDQKETLEEYTNQLINILLEYNFNPNQSDVNTLDISNVPGGVITAIKYIYSQFKPTINKTTLIKMFYHASEYNQKDNSLDAIIDFENKAQLLDNIDKLIKSFLENPNIPEKDTLFKKMIQDFFAIFKEDIRVMENSLERYLNKDELEAFGLREDFDVTAFLYGSEVRDTTIVQPESFEELWTALHQSLNSYFNSKESIDENQYPESIDRLRNLDDQLKLMSANINTGGSVFRFSRSLQWHSANIDVTKDRKLNTTEFKLTLMGRNEYHRWEQSQALLLYLKDTLNEHGITILESPKPSATAQSCEIKFKTTMQSVKQQEIINIVLNTFYEFTYSHSEYRFGLEKEDTSDNKFLLFFENIKLKIKKDIENIQKQKDLKDEVETLFKTIDFSTPKIKKEDLKDEVKQLFETIDFSNPKITVSEWLQCDFDEWIESKQDTLKTIDPELFRDQIDNISEEIQTYLDIEKHECDELLDEFQWKLEEIHEETRTKWWVTLLDMRDENFNQWIQSNIQKLETLDPELFEKLKNDIDQQNDSFSDELYRHLGMDYEEIQILFDQIQNKLKEKEIPKKAEMNLDDIQLEEINNIEDLLTYLERIKEEEMKLVEKQTYKIEEIELNSDVDEDLKSKRRNETDELKRIKTKFNEKIIEVENKIIKKLINTMSDQQIASYLKTPFMAIKILKHYHEEKNDMELKKCAQAIIDNKFDYKFKKTYGYNQDGGDPGAGLLQLKDDAPLESIEIMQTNLLGICEELMKL